LPHYYVECTDFLQFSGIILQIIGTTIIVAQGLRGQVKISEDVTINEKGHLDISRKLAIGILAVMGGLITQAVSFLDLAYCS